MAYESQKSLNPCMIFEVKALNLAFVLCLHFSPPCLLLSKKELAQCLNPNNKINLH